MAGCLLDDSLDVRVTGNKMNDRFGNRDTFGYIENLTLKSFFEEFESVINLIMTICPNLQLLSANGTAN